MTPAPKALFQPGQRAVCARHGLWVLVDRPPTDPLILSLWEVIDGGGSTDEVVGSLLSVGMATLPDFALAARVGAVEVRLVVRGDLVVHGSGEEGTFEVRGRGILTDETRPLPTSLWLRPGDAGASPEVPLVAGILPAESVAVTFAGEPGSSASPRATSDSFGPATPMVTTSGDTRDEGGIPPSGPADPTSPEPVSASGIESDEESSMPAVKYEHLFRVPPSDPEPPIVPEPSTGSRDDASPQSPPRTATAPAVVVAPDAPAASPADAQQATAPAGPVFIDTMPDFLGSRPPVSPGTAPPPVTAPAETSVPGTPQGGGAVGRTVNRAMLHRRSSPEVMVWAARCPAGHLSQAHAATCRVCRRPMPQQAPQEVPRPLLGRLVIAGIDPIPLDSDLILGRDPHAPPEVGAAPVRLVVLNDPRMEVSSQHAGITRNWWDVCVTDLGSTNGTEIIAPDGRRQRLAQHTPVTVVPGTRIILAEVLELTFEAVE